MKQKISYSLAFLVTAMLGDVHAQVTEAEAKVVKWLCSSGDRRPSGVTVKVPAKGLMRFFVDAAEVDVHLNQKEIEELRLKSYNECLTKVLHHSQTVNVVEHPSPTPVVVQPTAKIINNRYQILANGAEVKDLQNNLIWQRCQVGMTWNGNMCTGKAKEFTFDNAKKQAGNGWRVPTIRELSSLIYCSSGKMKYSDDVKDGGASIENGCDGDYTRPTINVKAFPNTPASDVWSGSPYAGDASFAWGVGFVYGLSYGNYRDGGYGVRLVRGGQ